MKFTRSAITLLFCSFCFLSPFTGCETKTSRPSRAVVPRLDDTDVLQQDDLVLGMEFLHRVNDANRFQVDPLQRMSNPLALPYIDRLALYHLNQWIAREARKTDAWSKPKLLDYVPRAYEEIQPLKEIDRMRFTRDDLEFLQGRIWQRDVARRVSPLPLEGSLAQWHQENSNQLSEEEQQQLSSALQLFDWTIRNVQLDAFPPEMEEPVAGASGKQVALRPESGVPGRGYLRYPYDTLLFGHGDAYERARVFMELCRALKIETVMLGIGESSGSSKPWTVAVMLGKHLFLFDAELGLPLPAENRRGVVTLAQLLAKPELLAQLNLSDAKKYWVQAKDLQTLWPLLSASPEEMSKRMWLLDRSVTGAKHLNVFSDVDALAERLKALPPLADSRPAIWKVPLECSLYDSIGRNLRRAKDPEFALKYDEEATMLEQPLTFLRQARQLQFEGSFDTPEEVQSRRREAERKGEKDPFKRDGGVVELYLANRPEERGIEDLAYSTYWQQYYGLQNLPEDPEQRRKFLEFFGGRIQRVRHDISYWLGLVQCEKGDNKNAITWFEAALPDEDDSVKSPWLPSIRYNLARCYENAGQAEKARELLKSDDSPQSYGNRLRALWLSEGG